MEKWFKKLVSKILIFSLFFGLYSLSFATVTFNPNGGNLGQATIGVPFTSPTTIVVTSTRGATADTGLQASTFSAPNLPAGITAVYTPDPATPKTRGTITISGTPNAAARTSTTITFAINDDDGRATSGNFTLTITLQIMTTTLPSGQVGTPYSQQLVARGGAPGVYTWRLVSGMLPPGLNLSSNGLISGTPTMPGIYNFTVEVTDGSQTVQQPLSITITSAAVVPISNEGQICYVKGIERTNGQITKTGDLYIKDLTTGTEKQITNLGNSGCILNPQFTTDGKKILFTYAQDGTNFSVYLVDVSSTVTDPSQGKINLGSVNVKYAAISTDSDGKTTGYLAYTVGKSDRTELWIYNYKTKTSSQLISQYGFTIRDLVFIDSSTIAFIGTSNNIQDIYTINVSGGVKTKITNNSSPSPKYGRLMVSSRNPLVSPYILLYSKSTYISYGNYTKFDVYALQGNVEYNLTNTSDIDEYDPAFFGDSSTTPPLATSGQMLYSANILSSVDIWQANYNIAGDTNTSKTQRTTDDPGEEGLVNWAPYVVITPPEDYSNITIEGTRFVYILNNQIYRANSDGSQATVLTDGTATKSEANLAVNGGKIVFVDDGNQGKKEIIIMNHDGTGIQVFAADNYNIKEASISPDGRWVVYVKEEGVDQYDIYAKNIEGGTETEITTGNYADIESVYFNPDMTKIVYSAYDGIQWDIYTKDVKVDNIAGTISPSPSSAPINLTNTPDIDERYPSFSNNGKKIIYVSNERDNRNQIYTMEVTGTDHELIVANPTNVSIAYPVYGPVYNATDGTDAIAYIMNGQIYTGYVYRNSLKNPLYTPGNNPVSGANPTGIMTSNKFGWGVIREKGTVVGKRYLPKRASGSLVYDIVIDVDEASVPTSFTLSEILPSDFNNITVKREGGASVTTTTYTDTPSTGLKTLKIVFYTVGGSSSNGGAKDHVLRITIGSLPSSGTYTISGELNYNLNGVSTKGAITGNGIIEITKPYLPVDIYDPFDIDNDGITDEPNGVIDDFDLLYAIDCWASDAQIPGYGPKWPLNTDNWDQIILDIINIWADATAKGAYDYYPTNPNAAHEMFWK